MQLIRPFHCCAKFKWISHKNHLTICFACSILYPETERIESNVLRSQQGRTTNCQAEGITQSEEPNAPPEFGSGKIQGRAKTELSPSRHGIVDTAPGKEKTSASVLPPANQTAASAHPTIIHPSLNHRTSAMRRGPQGGPNAVDRRCERRDRRNV